MGRGNIVLANSWEVRDFTRGDDYDDDDDGRGGGEEEKEDGSPPTPSGGGPGGVPQGGRGRGRGGGAPHDLIGLAHLHGIGGGHAATAVAAQWRRKRGDRIGSG